MIEVHIQKFSGIRRTLAHVVFHLYRYENSSVDVGRHYFHPYFEYIT
jgi:hypothetical protein